MDGRQGDRAIVAALAAGDPWGLDQAYRRYAPRLLAYCVSLLHDGHAAADAVQDTFLLAAQRAGQLRDAERLPAWLFAIARHECLRHVKARKRQAPLEEASPLPADDAEPEPVAGLHAEQVRELVNAAATGLNSGDREIIELAIRHGLSVSDVGAVLGLPSNHVHARLSRARAQLERAIGVLLVARHGRSACASLDAELQHWDGGFDAKLRKRLGRHIDGCAVCQARRGQLISPSALLVAYGLLPLGGLARALLRPTPPSDSGIGQGSTLDPPSDDSSALAQGSAPAQGGSTASRDGSTPAPTLPLPQPPTDGPAQGPVSPILPGRPTLPIRPSGPAGAGPPRPPGRLRLDPKTGFPLQDNRKRRRDRAAVLLLVLLLLLCCGATPTLLRQWGGTTSLADWLPAPALNPEPTYEATETPSATATSTGPPQPSSPSTPTSSPAGKVKDPPPPPVVSPSPSLKIIVISSTMSCMGALDFRLTVRVLSQSSMINPRLYWRIQGGSPQSMAMTQTDRTHANVTKQPLIGRSIEWWVQASTPDGLTGETAHVTAANPCLSPGP